MVSAGACTDGEVSVVSTCLVYLVEVAHWRRLSE
jgi:hypothetical protein